MLTLPLSANLKSRKYNNLSLKKNKISWYKKNWLSFIWKLLCNYTGLTEKVKVSTCRQCSVQKKKSLSVGWVLGQQKSHKFYRVTHNNSSSSLPKPHIPAVAAASKESCAWPLSLSAQTHDCSAWLAQGWITAWPACSHHPVPADSWAHHWRSHQKPHHPSLLYDYLLLELVCSLKN